MTDKSLVRQTGSVDGEPRFGMLQTIQEFALEQLSARGDLERLRAAHADYFIELADIGGPELLVGDQRRWMQRMAADHDNVRAALRELLATGQAGRAARLGWSVLPFWVGRQPLHRGHRVDASRACQQRPGSRRAGTGQPHVGHPVFGLGDPGLRAGGA